MQFLCDLRCNVILETLTVSFTAMNFLHLNYNTNKRLSKLLRCGPRQFCTKSRIQFSKFRIRILLESDLTSKNVKSLLRKLFLSNQIITIIHFFQQKSSLWFWSIFCLLKIRIRVYQKSQILRIRNTAELAQFT